MHDFTVWMSYGKWRKNWAIRLLPLAPYSPELNPIEKVWANIKRYLRTVLSDYARFDDALVSYFDFNWLYFRRPRKRIEVVWKVETAWLPHPRYGGIWGFMPTTACCWVSTQPTLAKNYNEWFLTLYLTQIIIEFDLRRFYIHEWPHRYPSCKL